MGITFIIINETRFFWQRARSAVLLVCARGRNSAWRDRVAYAEYWEALFKVMEDKFRRLAEAHFRLYIYKAMQEWHNRIGDMNERSVPAWIRRDSERRFRGLASDVAAASLMRASMLPKYVSAAFGSLDLPLETRPPPQRLRQNASLSVEQSYKDFYVRIP